MKAFLVVLFCLFINSVDARSIHGAANVLPTTTQGNPFVTITNGTIAGSIADSRTGDGSTFRTPFFVQVSASGITATGTSAPYEDLGYSWNFGEGCGDSFTRPTDGVTVCSGTDQTGPEAAYVYRTAGTKTVTLTVTGSNGTCAATGICNTVTPYVVTKSWTVNAFPTAAEQWADCSFAGTASGTLANPWKTVAQINTALLANNVLMHVNRGTSCTGSTALTLGGTNAVTGIRVDAYGTGANPIFNINSGTASALNITSNNGSSTDTSVHDVVFSNIDFSKSPGSSPGGNGAITVGTAGNATATLTNIYWDNSTVTMTYDGASSYAQIFLLPTPPAVVSPNLANNFGLWNVTVTSPTNTTTLAIGVDGSAQNWHFFVGGSVTGAGENTAADHHIYDDIKTHGYYAWVTCGPTGTGGGKRNFCFNGNWDGNSADATDHQIAQYRTYLSNSCQYTSNCIDLGSRGNNFPSATFVGSTSGTTLTVTSYTSGFVPLGPYDASIGYSIGDITGNLAIGTKITGSSTVNPTFCSPNCTGAGSTGTYAINTSQNVASETMQLLDSTVQFQYIVMQGNALNGMTGQEQMPNGLSLTWRDNRMFNTSAMTTGSFYQPQTIGQVQGYTQSTNLLSRGYRNKVYMASGAASGGIIYFDGPAGTWTKAQTWGYNSFVDARASSEMTELSWSDHLSAGSTFEFNTYCSTAGDTTAWKDTGVSTKTFANWQAAGTSPNRWDLSGANLANPCTALGWTLPVTQWSHMGP